MGTLTRKSTTPRPRSSHIAPPCQAAKRRRRLLSLRKHQPNPASLASSLLSHLVSHRGNHSGNHCRSYRSNQVVDDQVEEDHLNSHLLSKPADKQEEGSLRTGGIPHGEVEAVRVKVGKTTTGRIALRGSGQALSLPEQAPSLPEGDEGMEAVVEGPVEEVGVVVGDAEEGAAAEEGVVMEDRALDRVVVAAADEVLAGAETGARPWQGGRLLPVAKSGRNSTRWER